MAWRMLHPATAQIEKREGRMPASFEMAIISLGARSVAWMGLTCLLCSCAPFFDVGPKPQTDPAARSPAVNAGLVDANHIAPTPRPAVAPDPPPRRIVSISPATPVRSATLTGMNPDAVHKLLGTPRSVVRRDVSFVWAYKAPNCVLRVVFYPNIDTKELRVLQYAVEDTGGKPIDDASHCMRDLQLRMQ